MTSPDRNRRGTGAPLGWQERQNWEEIEHLASSALKLLDNPATSDLAMALVGRVEACTNHLKSIARNKGE